MTTRFRLEHTLNTDVVGFWRDIFENESFNESVYRNALGFRYELLLWDPGTGTRQAKVWPTADVPKTLASVMGDSIAFVEEGLYDRGAQRYDFTIVPTTLSDRIRTRGSVVAVPIDDSTCKRIVEIEIEVRVLGLGRIAESFLETTTREQYDVNADYANRYLAAQKSA
ncbi:MAG: DUF2505 family protein [Polyangiales bacterium]